MSEPQISICIPAFKAEKYLLETLESVRAQTFAHWELIVVEDGSHDRTEEIVREFAGSVDQPVRFERHPENRGLPATRNTCIARAVAPFVALLDSDDLWTPDHLANLVQRASETGADLIHSGVVLFASETGEEIELRVASEKAIDEFPRSLFLADYAIQPSSVLLRRSLWGETGGFDPNCRYVEDREFWMRLVRAGARVSYVPAITCRYRQHSSAMSKNAAAMALGCAEVFERNADWQAVPLDLRRQSAAEGWCSAGRIIMKEDPTLAQDYFGRALRHASGSPRLLAYWFAATVLAISKRRQRI
ncbi:MAG TPA: glycosyltransferase family 2 protein [Chthoniobacterales bacterium]